MSRPIAPTPILNRKESLRFIERGEKGLSRPAYPIPTPRAAKAIERIMADARRQEKERNAYIIE